MFSSGIGIGRVLATYAKLDSGTFWCPFKISEDHPDTSINGYPFLFQTTFSPLLYSILTAKQTFISLAILLTVKISFRYTILQNIPWCHIVVPRDALFCNVIKTAKNTKTEFADLLFTFCIYYPCVVCHRN